MCVWRTNSGSSCVFLQGFLTLDVDLIPHVPLVHAKVVEFFQSTIVM
jgi:hypothetical protein